MRTLNILFIFILFLELISCSNDFLYYKNTLVEMSTDTIRVYSSYEKHTNNITISYSLNAEYTIAQYPKYMTFERMNGIFSGGVTQFTFKSGDLYSFINSGRTAGLMVLNVKGYGLVGYPVQITPIIQKGNITFSNKELNIGTDPTTKIVLSNIGNMVSTWNIASLPSAISANKMSGNIYPNGIDTIVFSIDHQNHTPGSYTSFISFSIDGSDSYNIAVNFTVPDNNPLPNTSDVEKLDGFILDVQKNKIQNKLLVLTENPNQILIINTEDSSKTKIDLPKRPSCLTIAPDGLSALVGYSVAQMALIDLNTNKITKKYNLPFVPYSIAISEKSWCYVTSTSNNNYRNLICLNLDSKTMVEKASYDIFEKNIVKIVPDKDILLTYTTQQSPSHLIFGNLSNDTISESLYINYNEDSSGAIWFIKNGIYLINKGKTVLKCDISAYNDMKLNQYGNMDGNYQSIHHVDECYNSDLLALSVSSGYISPAGVCYVSIWNFESFSQINSILPPIVNNTTTYVYFSFFNSSGNKLFIFLRDNNDPYSTSGNWFLKIVDIKTN